MNRVFKEIVVLLNSPKSNNTKKESMKQQLITLYNQRKNDFKNLIEKFPSADLAGPFLMSPNEKYSTQPNKLLVIGQETQGWTYHTDDLELQMETYENFNLGEKYYSSPFWNITRKLEKVLGNNEYTHAWSNLNKFDLNAGKPKGKYVDAIKELDDILIGEIKIVQPDICIFFTGPTHDNRLKTIFEQIEFIEIPNFTLRQFCKLKHPQLPKHSFRSHHPKSLRLRHLEKDFVEYLSNIGKEHVL